MNRQFLSTDKAILFVKILGIIQLVIGFSFLWLAPVEIYSFYLFSEGGPFYYDGFHIGSFIHGLVVAQILAFYAIGVLFIIIGYGHIKLKTWTLNLSIGSIWFWIILGLPVMIFNNGLFPLFGKFLTGHSGIFVYGFLIILMTLFIYGLFKRIHISCIISVVFFGLLLISATITILNYDFISIIELMDLPKLEYDIFIKLPVKAFYLLIPVAYILTVSLIIVFRTRNYYDKN